MAHFVRIGGRIINLHSVSFAERDGQTLIVRLVGDAQAVVFKGDDADRVEAEILRLQDLINESIRRSAVARAIDNYK